MTYPALGKYLRAFYGNLNSDEASDQREDDIEAGGIRKGPRWRHDDTDDELEDDEAPA